MPVLVPAPAPRDAGTVTSRDTTCDLAIRIDKTGVWIGAAPDVRCFSARAAGAVDTAWLEGELRALRAARHPDCGSSLELAADPDVQYQDVVTVMDVAIKVGFYDVGLSSPAELSITFAAGPAPAPRCPMPPRAAPAPVQPRPARSLLLPARDRLQHAPIIIVTKTAISLGGKELLSVAAAAAGDGLIPGLTAALGTSTDGLVILQADQSIDARVINRIVTTAKAAGFDNLLFAVKKQ